MTQDEFRRRWRGKWLEVGMETLAVLQGKSEALGGNKANALLELPAKIDSLLERMWRDLQNPPAPVPANGIANRVKE